MLAVASCDDDYRHIFHEDAIKAQTKEMDEGDLINLFMRMGFVMAKSAEIRDRKERRNLNEDSYLDWLDGFERADYINALPDIRATYEGQRLTTSEEKKSTDQ